MKKFLNWVKSPASDFVLFLILLVLANLVGHKAFVRFDLTKPKSYSLSKSTKQIVKTLDEPLSIKVFFDDNLPSPYSNNAQYVKDLLVEYEGAANRNFSVSYMDMKKDDNQKLASDFGLRKVQIQEVKNNEIGFKQVYMGLAVSYGDSIEVMDTITSIDGFEYKLTSTISKMISKVDTLSGLGKGNKLNLTLYMSSSLKSLRISGIDQVEDIVRNAYINVNKQNLDRLSFTVQNPPSAEAEILADTYGIQAVQFQNGNQRENAVFGLVISFEDNFRTIPVTIERGFFGYSVGGLGDVEESLNSGIQSLLSKTTRVGFVVGHSEHSIKNEQDSANFDKLVSSLYELVEVDLYAGDVPAGMNTIIVDGPQSDFSEEELYRIDQFIMKGGNVMFFVDPMYPVGGSQYQLPTYRPLNNNINFLLESYGVKAEKNFVMDKQCYETASQQYGKMSLYYAPTLQNKDLAQRSPITKNLGYVIMLQNGSIDVSAAKENKDLKVTVLAKSSPEAWLETNNVQLNPMMLYPPSSSECKSYDLAALVEGKFKSAFDEPPVHMLIDDEGNEVAIDTTDDEFKTQGHIASSRIPGKIFVCNSSQVTTYQVLDAQGESPIGMFLMNVLDYMNGNEELCTMRTKGLSLNTLNIKSMGLAQAIKYFNTAGLVILVVLAGFIVWRLRTKRRAAIRKRYNPNDQRTITKGGE